MSYKAEFLTIGDPKWYPNGIAFETSDEAAAYGRDKWSKWTQAEQARVVESDEPANYRWVDGGLVPIERSEAPVQA